MAMSVRLTSGNIDRAASIGIKAPCWAAGVSSATFYTPPGTAGPADVMIVNGDGQHATFVRGFGLTLNPF